MIGRLCPICGGSEIAYTDRRLINISVKILTNVVNKYNTNLIFYYVLFKCVFSLPSSL